MALACVSWWGFQKQTRGQVGGRGCAGMLWKQCSAQLGGAKQPLSLPAPRCCATRSFPPAAQRTVAYFNSTHGPSTDLNITLDKATLATVEVPGQGSGLTVSTETELSASRPGRTFGGGCWE